MNKLKESGLLDKYWMQWKPQARTDCFSSQSVDPIKIQSVISLFIMLSAFVIISMTIYILELLIKKKKVVIPTNESNSNSVAAEADENITPMNSIVRVAHYITELVENLKF